jgi:DNA-binding CsgD family transcriptional regulator
VVVDDERRHVRVNEAAVELLGAPVDELLRQGLEDYTPPEHWSRLDELWAEFRARGELEGDYEVLRADGSRRLIEFRATWDFGPGEHLIAARALHGTRARSTNGAVLTRREREVLQLAADGLSIREIAGRLVVSPGTVKTHFQNIYEKLAAHDRASAVAEGLRQSIIR